MMPRFETAVKMPPPPPTDVSYVLGWTVDIYAMQNGVEKIIYRDCSLATLVRASSLFERLALDICTKPLAYGEETKIKYILPKALAAAAFHRILDWIYAVREIEAHGEVEDPQITTFDQDGLMQLLRLFQAANLMELKYPLHNQKRLPDMIKAHIKKAFDTKNNAFRHITITDLEIGVIWDVGGGNRNDGNIKLMLALFVDAYDLRAEAPYKWKDGILERFTALMNRNAAFKSAVIDVRTKKTVRLREEERERRGEPKVNRGRRGGAGRRRTGSGEKNGQRASWEDHGDWEGRELTESQVRALMSRPEEFQVKQNNAW